MHEMDVVKSDLYKEEDADTLSDINSMEATGDTRNQDEFIELHGISESEVVDLPMSDYVIDEDGSSPMDKFTPPENTENDELLDMPPLENSKVESEEDILSIEEGDDIQEETSAEIVEDVVPASADISDDDIADELAENSEETLSLSEDTVDTLPALDEVSEDILDTLPALDEVSENLEDALPEVSEDLLDTLSASDEVVEELPEVDVAEEVLETAEETVGETVDEAPAEAAEEIAEDFVEEASAQDTENEV